VSTQRRRVARLRVASQRATGGAGSPGELVQHLFAVQAQEFASARWALGLRLPGSTDDSILLALERREIVRSWPLRGTLHLVPPEDLRWMLELSRPRHAKPAAKRREQLGITDRELARAGDVAIEAMTGGRSVRRDALLSAWEAVGIPTGGRAYHLLWHLGSEGIIVFGAPDGRQPTFALLDEWIAHSRRLEGDEALAEVARRYFRSHGPATVRDLAWWSSMTLADARRGLELVRPEFAALELDGETLFYDPTLETAAAGVLAMPGFDELVLGYQDRSVSVAPENLTKVLPGKNGQFLATVLLDGVAVATWRRERETSTVVSVALQPFDDRSPARLGAGFAKAMRRYGSFLGKDVEVL
jgi:hypothetical protein